MSQQQSFNSGGLPGVPNIEFIRGNDGVPVGPNPATHIIELIGDTAQGVSTSNTAPFTEQITVQDATAAATALLALKGVSSYSNNDFVVTAGFVTLKNPGTPEWTDYVVDAAGNAPYTTIQSALDAANAAGYKLVLVHYGAGNYVEDLTLYDQITIMGIQEDVDSPVPVLITGTHTPPNSGSVAFVNLRLNDATAVISSAAAISTRISFINCSLGVTNGYTCDTTASTGVVYFEDCTFSGLDDGAVNNATGTASIGIKDSSIGGGAGLLVTGGFLQSNNSSINCACIFLGTASATLSDSVTAGLTLLNSSTLSVVGSRLGGAGLAAITQSSSGAISLVNVAIDSNNNPAIDGAGAGTITLAGVPFLNNAVIAGTLTTAAYSWKPYGTSGNTGTAIRGTAGYNSDDFVVTDGFVSLNNNVSGTAQTIGAVTANVITLPLGATPGTYALEGRIAGFEPTTPAASGFQIFATVRTDGATATLVGIPDIVGNSETALGSSLADVVVSGNNAIIQVTGVVALTIDWGADLQYTMRS